MSTMCTRLPGPVKQWIAVGHRDTVWLRAKICRMSPCLPGVGTEWNDWHQTCEYDARILETNIELYKWYKIKKRIPCFAPYLCKSKKRLWKWWEIFFVSLIHCKDIIVHCKSWFNANFLLLFLIIVLKDKMEILCFH